MKQRICEMERTEAQVAHFDPVLEGRHPAAISARCHEC